jgi:hypothetical protein
MQRKKAMRSIAGKKKLEDDSEKKRKDKLKGSK